MKIVGAGPRAWPGARASYNLRATLATGLTASLSSHVVATWLGLTEAIAEAHYWQTTESHYEVARNWTPVTAAHTAAVSCRNERNRQESGENTPCPNSSPGRTLQGKSLLGNDLGINSV